MRKPGLPPSQRNQAVSSLLSMSLVRQPDRPRQVRRLDRCGAIPTNSAAQPDRLRARSGPDERQQHRTFLLHFLHSFALSRGFLLRAQLLELEVIPQLTEAPVLRVAKPGRPQHVAGLVRAIGQAEPGDDL